MLTKPTYTMWFVVWNKTLQYRKLVFCIIHLHALMIYIFSMLYMILPIFPFFSTWPFLCFPLYKTQCLCDALDKSFWNYCTKITSELCVPVLTTICVLNCSLPGSFTVEIRWNMNLFIGALRLYTTSLLCPGALVLRSIIIINDWDDIKISIILYQICNTLHSHWYSPKFTDSRNQKFSFYNFSLIPLVCSVFVDASCLPWSDINDLNIACCMQLCKYNKGVSWYLALNFSNEMLLIDKYLVPPYHYDCIGVQNLLLHVMCNLDIILYIGTLLQS